MYDISDNKLRSEVAKACKQIGLKRMQKSVFYGETRISLLNRFKRATADLLNEQTDSIIILPVTKKGMKKLLLVGKKKIRKKIKRRIIRFL